MFEKPYGAAGEDGGEQCCAEDADPKTKQEQEPEDKSGLENSQPEFGLPAQPKTENNNDILVEKLLEFPEDDHESSPLSEELLMTLNAEQWMNLIVVERFLQHVCPPGQVLKMKQLETIYAANVLAPQTTSELGILARFREVIELEEKKFKDRRATAELELGRNLTDNLFYHDLDDENPVRRGHVDYLNKQKDAIQNLKQNEEIFRAIKNQLTEPYLYVTFLCQQHFQLFRVCSRDRTIQIFDNMNSVFGFQEREKYLSSLLWYLGMHTTGEVFRKEVIPPGANTTSGTECGPFVCLYAATVKEEKLPMAIQRFQETDAANFREIIRAVVTGQDPNLLLQVKAFLSSTKK